MGASVPSPARVAPPKWRMKECPTCGNRVRVASGAWLKHKRQAALLDQRSFGETIGISGPYISDLESNRRDCPPFILRFYERLKAKP